MLQVRKSCSCGIFAIFFQCCFMIETQAINEGFRFFRVFFQESLSGRGLHFSMGAVCFSVGGGFIFKWGHQFGWGAEGGFEKKLQDGGGASPLPLTHTHTHTIGNPAHQQISKKGCFKKYCSCDKTCQFSALQGTP